MDLTKFTERARGFMQAAQTIALRENHQRLNPLHILKALLDDPEGFSANLILRTGGNYPLVREQIDTELDKFVKIKNPNTKHITKQPKTKKYVSDWSHAN